MHSIRVRFKKIGDARYISHLDLTRYFSRMLRRTDIPVWYTEGFNPRVYMVFALSLPLSVEGENEFLDLRLTDDAYACETVLMKLRQVSVPGIEITAVDEPQNGVGDITYARYTASLMTDELSQLKNHIDCVLSNDTLIVTKTSKKGPVDIDIKEHLTDFSVTESPQELIMHFTLPAGSVFNINPLLFTEAVFKDSGFDYHNVIIKRQALLLSDKTDFC